MNEKPLSEMTLEELWQLFPIQLVEHDPTWAEWYAEESEKLVSILGSRISRIDHIGSTYVDGLLAKPIVDILLQISPVASIDDTKAALVSNGWLVMAADPGSSEIDLNKGYTQQGFAEKVFHLHVRMEGDWDELHFRDYLTSHLEARIEYAELKRHLLVLYEHNRDAYTSAKTDFVRACVAKARRESVRCSS